MTPGEQYLHALWRGRWLFLLIVGAFVGGALIVTQFLPKTFASDAILSVKPAPQLEPAATLYSAATIGVGTYRADDLVEQGPRRFVRRFQAISVVTLAARDAGLIGPTDVVDERTMRRWVSVENVEKTDLLTMTISQPTAATAQRLGTAMVARATEASRAEATPDASTREFLERERQRAAAAMTEAETGTTHAAATPGAGRELAIERAKLELSLARDQYAAVRKRIGLLELIVANQQFQLSIVDPPTLPLIPSFPRPVLNVGIGLILGVLAATTFIVLRNVLKGS